MTAEISDNGSPTSVFGSISEKFNVEKSKCWFFTKTVRIDIKPICLMINKTNYRFESF